MLFGGDHFCCARVADIETMILIYGSEAAVLLTDTVIRMTIHDI